MHKIGIFGSAEGNLKATTNKARTLGRELSSKNVILITGASTGLPYEVALEAAKLGTKIWGYSQATDFKQQQKLIPGEDYSIYSKLFYIPRDYEFAGIYEICKKYRNVTSTANCDAGIIISGRWGTLNEFTNLYDMGKVIGVLTGTGGIADELHNLYKKIHKKSKAKLIFNSDPKLLTKRILNELGHNTR